jgi:uncharacterized membrane protein YesL
MKEQKIFELIGRIVVCGAIWLSFVGILVYGLMNATTLN